MSADKLLKMIGPSSRDISVVYGIDPIDPEVAADERKIDRPV